MRYWLVLCLIGCLLVSCEPDNSLLTDWKIVLNAELYNDSIVKAYIRFSNLLGNDADPSDIRDAEVRLYADGELVDRLVYRPFIPGMSSDEYKGTHIIRKGVRYRMEVQVPGYPLVSAEAELPEQVPFEIVGIQEASYGMLLPEGWVTQHNAWLVQIAINDPPDTDNYYRLHSHPPFVRFNDHSSVVPISPQLDLVFDRYLRLFDKEWIVMDIINDRSFNGKRHIVNYYLTYDIYHTPDTVDHQFWLRTMSKDDYLYYKSARLQTDLSDDMFSEPVQVHNNIRNGLGHFGCTDYRSALVSIHINDLSFEVRYDLNEDYP